MNNNNNNNNVNILCNLLIEYYNNSSNQNVYKQIDNIENNNPQLLINALYNIISTYGINDQITIISIIHLKNVLIRFTSNDVNINADNILKIANYLMSNLFNIELLLQSITIRHICATVAQILRNIDINSWDIFFNVLRFNEPVIMLRSAIFLNEVLSVLRHHRQYKSVLQSVCCKLFIEYLCNDLHKALEGVIINNSSKLWLDSVESVLEVMPIYLPIVMSILDTSNGAFEIEEHLLDNLMDESSEDSFSSIEDQLSSTKTVILAPNIKNEIQILLKQFFPFFIEQSIRPLSRKCLKYISNTLLQCQQRCPIAFVEYLGISSKWCVHIIMFNQTTTNTTSTTSTTTTITTEIANPMVHDALLLLYHILNSSQYQLDDYSQYRLMVQQILSTSIMKQLCEILITKYLSLSNDDIIQLQNDPQIFIQSERLTHLETSIRLAAQQLFICVVKNNINTCQPIIQSLYVQSMQVIDSNNIDIINKDVLWFALGSCLNYVELCIDKSCDTVITDLFINFWSSIQTFPILQRRLLWFLEQYDITEQTIQIILPIIIQTLTNQYQLVVRLQSSQVLSSLLSSLKYQPNNSIKQLLSEESLTIISHIFQLINDCSDIKTKRQVLCNIRFLIEVIRHDNIISKLSEVLYDLWQSCQNNNSNSSLGLIQCEIVLCVGSCITVYRQKLDKIDNLIFPLLNSSLDVKHNNIDILIPYSLQVWNKLLIYSSNISNRLMQLFNHFTSICGIISMKSKESEALMNILSSYLLLLSTNNFEIVLNNIPLIISTLQQICPINHKLNWLTTVTLSKLFSSLWCNFKPIDAYKALAHTFSIISMTQLCSNEVVSHHLELMHLRILTTILITDISTFTSTFNSCCQNYSSFNAKTILDKFYQASQHSASWFSKYLYLVGFIIYQSNMAMNMNINTLEKQLEYVLKVLLTKPNSQNRMINIDNCTPGERRVEEIDRKFENNINLYINIQNILSNWFNQLNQQQNYKAVVSKYHSKFLSFMN